MNFKSKLIASKKNGLNKNESNKLDVDPPKSKDDFNNKYIGFFKTVKEHVLTKEIKSEKKNSSSPNTFVTETRQRGNSLQAPDVELFQNRRTLREKSQQLLSSFDLKKNIKEIKEKLEKKQTQDEHQTPLTPKK